MHLGGNRRWVPLFTVSRENVHTPTMTRIMISQKKIEEKICKLKVKKAMRPDGVSTRLLKYVGISIAHLSRAFLNRVLKPASHQTSGK